MTKYDYDVGEASRKARPSIDLTTVSSNVIIDQCRKEDLLNSCTCEKDTRVNVRSVVSAFKLHSVW